MDWQNEVWRLNTDLLPCQAAVRAGIPPHFSNFTRFKKKVCKVCTVIDKIFSQIQENSSAVKEIIFDT